MSNDPNKPSTFPSTVMESRLTEKYREGDILEPYLIVLSGFDRGKQFKLNRQENRFGRAPDADIVLSDPKISRYHGAFIIFPDEIIVEDFQSSNGIYVDGKPILKAKISLTSRLQVGSTHLKIDYKKPEEADSDQALYRAANIDALTGILNRGAFITKAQEEMILSANTKTTLSVILCDVDHFKVKNDTYGHLAGDHILRELGGLLTAQMRKYDLLARYGGEEFIMLLPETKAKEALDWAERVRATVAEHRFEFNGLSIPTTISIGICCRTNNTDSLTATIQAADEALYSAKKSGRNRVELATSEPI